MFERSPEVKHEFEIRFQRIRCNCIMIVDDFGSSPISVGLTMILLYLDSSVKLFENLEGYLVWCSENTGRFVYRKTGS